MQVERGSGVSSPPRYFFGGRPPGVTRILDAFQALGRIPGTPAAGLLPRRIKDALAELKALRAADEQAWFVSFQNVVTELARDLGLTAPVEVTLRGDDDAPSDDGELVGLIFATAVQTTPLPGSGRAPADYDGLVWETEIAEDRAPYQRIITQA